MAGNIGRARIKVSFLDKSPFSGQPRQEVTHYFSEDTVSPMSPYNVSALPKGVNGIRLNESLNNYDNFLSDGDYYIDEATYGRSVETSSSSSSGASSQTVATTVPVASDATARIKQLEDDRKNATQQQQANFAAQKKFFTWVLSSPIFKDSPPPEKFATPPSINNAPAWTLVTFPRPGTDDKVRMLTPFMRKSPPDRKSPIHWGCKMAEPIAQNQPFEIIFYFCQREPSNVDLSPKLTPIFKFVAEDGVTQLDLSLHNSIYMATEFGLGDPNHHFLLVFQSEQAPVLFHVNGKTATRAAVFEGFNSSTVFDPSHKFFSVKIEPVTGAFIIRSNVFENTPWIVTTPPNSPYFIGKGAIAVYSGNVQAGFAMRPIQYESTGDFSTPPTDFTILEGGGVPECSTTIKGPGTVQQTMSYNSSGDVEVSLADAEQINGMAAKTYLEASSGETGRDGGVNRKITLRRVEVTPSNKSPENEDTTTKAYKVEVTMNASDVTQGGGYVVTNGRSPYLWLVRCGLAAADGPGQTCAGLECDISCDVLSVDLTHNATSYNELTHNGTMRVLNKVANRLNGLFDYRSYTNRAVYIRIEAWWENGVGHDPGGGDRNIFEGIAYGGTTETRAETEIITFKLEDYMSALVGSKFLLCPPYDGMKASLAVRDMMHSIGFPDARIRTGNVAIADANLGDDYGLSFLAQNGAEPQFRFKDGTSIKEGILKIAKLHFRTIYFDRFGNFQYDQMPGGVFAPANAAASIEFVSSPDGELQLNSLKRIAWNMVAQTTNVADVYNIVQIHSVDKATRAYLNVAIPYKPGQKDPKARGYLGYTKHLLIQDAAYGNIGAVNRAAMEYASRVFIPPITGRFEIYGYTGMKPLDIIKLDGQRLRIMNMTTHLSAAENTYWQTIEGEWFDSITLPGAPGAEAPVTPQPSSPPSSGSYTGG